MRKLLFLLVFLCVVGSTLSSHADDTCVDDICIDISGKVIDPHGTGVPNIVVWAQGVNQTRTFTTSDAAGHYEFHLLNSKSFKGCYLVGAQPDAYYAAGIVGNYCQDTDTAIAQTAYRTVAIGPKGREFFHADTTAPVPVDLEVYVNSHTYPAPFETDPMTWTVTDHPAGQTTRVVAQEGTFTTRTVTKIADGWQYVWKARVVIQPHGVSMVHLDWGLNSVFASMMDCRMYWFGMGMTKVSPANALPGQVVTIDGMGFGTQRGKVYISIDRSTRSAYIDPSYIVTWTPTRIEFVVPSNASSGWFRVFIVGGLGPPCLGLTVGTPSPRQFLTVDAKAAALSAVPAA